MPLHDYPIFQNVSLEDFKARFDSIEHLEGKLDFSYSYLLSHGLGSEEPECGLDELLHYAKSECLQASLSHHGKGLSPEAEERRAAFFANPTRFLSDMGKKMAEKVDGDPSLNEEERGTLHQWKDNCLRIGREMENHKESFADYERAIVPEEILGRVSQKVFGRNDVGVEECLDRNKGGLFERKLGSTAPEYKAFEQAFRDYNNTQGSHFADKATLKDAAMGYIRHKFPDLREGELPTPEQLGAIRNPTSKGRLEFAVSLAQELAAQEKAEEIANAFDRRIDPEQSEFQRDLAENLEEKDDYEPHAEGEQEEIQAEIGINQ